MEITPGTVVFSKAGRDKNNMFIVLSVDEKFAYITDGDLRKVEKPKKKKLIHLQRTKNVLQIESDIITNSEVRRLLAQYKSV